MPKCIPAAACRAALQKSNKSTSTWTLEINFNSRKQLKVHLIKVCLFLQQLVLNYFNFFSLVLYGKERILLFSGIFLWETLKLYEFSIKCKVVQSTVNEKRGLIGKDRKSIEYVQHEWGRSPMENSIYVHVLKITVLIICINTEHTIPFFISQLLNPWLCNLCAVVACDVASFGCVENTIRTALIFFFTSVTVALCVPQTMAHVPCSLAELLRMKLSCLLILVWKVNIRLCYGASFSSSVFWGWGEVWWSHMKPIPLVAVSVLSWGYFIEGTVVIASKTVKMRSIRHINLNNTLYSFCYCISCWTIQLVRKMMEFR